jgi:hypothetical protein
MTESHPTRAGEAVVDPAERPQNRGAQPGNRNARRHGLYAIRRSVAELCPDDHDSELARGMAAVRQELADELGGLPSLSAQTILVLDEIARVKVYRDTVDEYLFEMKLGAIIDRRKRSLKPIVRERVRLGETLVKHLALIGLERKVPQVPALKDYLAEKSPRAQGLATATPVSEGGQAPQEPAGASAAAPPCDVGGES